MGACVWLRLVQDPLRGCLGLKLVIRQQRWCFQGYRHYAITVFFAITIFSSTGGVEVTSWLDERAELAWRSKRLQTTMQKQYPKVPGRPNLPRAFQPCIAAPELLAGHLLESVHTVWQNIMIPARCRSQ